MAELEQIKLTMSEASQPNQSNGPIITASPLDYHVFRQEIISKYPAFSPPQPLFPFEPENNSILPPLYEDASRTNSIIGGLDARPGNVQGIGASINAQPVHIATPLPSPPPSPAGPGGKLMKKQNYQTNQMFPFLYPPLDQSSNDLGGKGSTELQDLFAGRKWQGSDIPASILEAAELFSNRMKATRPMKQLWEERVRYLKFERGYNPLNETVIGNAWFNGDDEPDRDEQLSGLDVDARRRLDAVNAFYAITVLITQPNGVDGLRTGEYGSEDEEDILKFEYFSQLLLDSNYVQLVLKLFSHQELEKVVNFKCERPDLNFFNWCATHASRTRSILNGSRHDASKETSSNQESEDEAAPPPVRFQRRLDSGLLGFDLNGVTNGRPTLPLRQPPPEVDELGYPVSALPLAPIVNFSWRAFFTSINHLRILQKLVKGKPHRQLLMVQSKYSVTLKKHLKVPQAHVRLYTLKIIKGQVPYCHRKWRASNMRIITAIYLHVKPDLRDEWLSGLDIEQEMGEAMPLEQALRALTFWWHLRTYPDEFGFARDNLTALDVLDRVDSDTGHDDEPVDKNDSLVNGATQGQSGIYPKAFDIDYDPFTTKTPEADDSMRRASLGGRSRGSTPLIGAEEDDFFLRELEKMDIGKALSGETDEGDVMANAQFETSNPDNHLGVGISSQPQGCKNVPAMQAQSSGGLDVNGNFVPAPGVSSSSPYTMTALDAFPEGSGIRHLLTMGRPLLPMANGSADEQELLAAAAASGAALEADLDENGNVVIRPSLDPDEELNFGLAGAAKPTIVDSGLLAALALPAEAVPEDEEAEAEEDENEDGEGQGAAAA